MIRLQLMSTSGCHLCEMAEQIIAECLLNNVAVTIELIDVAEQEQFQARYAIRIPVLYHPETNKDLGWPFDFVQVNQFITDIRQS